MKSIEKCEFENDDVENDDKLNCHNKANLWITSRTLMQWFRDFRMNRESFVNVPKRRSFIKRLPPIFDDNPDMKNKFMNFAKENLVNLNPELMYDYCNDKYRYRKIKASGREFLAAILRCRFQDSGDVHPICGETHTGVQVSPQMPSKRIGLRA